jgi:hypothetical protein
MFGLLRCIAFHFLFYTGSHVEQSQYHLLANALTKRLPNSTFEFMPSSPFSTHPLTRIQPKDKCVLVGHSLGGVFAAVDSQKYVNKVCGLVLLNSHFNERMKMPYPGMIQSDILIPTLVILAGKDVRLPLIKALDDFYMKVRDNLHNKHFIVNTDFDHFDGITNKNGQQNIVEQITAFLNDSLPRVKGEYLDVRQYSSTNVSLISSEPISFADAILQLYTPKYLWRSLKWFHFLYGKPFLFPENTMFEADSHILWKHLCNNTTEQDEITHIRTFLQTWLFGAEFQLKHIHIDNEKASPMAFLKWVFLPLKANRIGDVIEIPIFSFRSGNVTYYKAPHLYQLYHLMPLETVIHNLFLPNI